MNCNHQIHPDSIFSRLKNQLKDARKGNLSYIKLIKSLNT